MKPSIFWCWVFLGVASTGLCRAADTPTAPTEPLVLLLSHGVKVPTDGTSVVFSLEKRHRKDPLGTLQAQIWTDDHDPKSKQPYHWKFILAVPDGGLQLRDEKQFTAPSTGYQASDTADLAPENKNWSDVCERHYFLQLPHGKYGRIHLFIDAKGGILIDGYVNPTGSQNLEYDPGKRNTLPGH